jgi:amino acid adenylation domain-containing protein
MLLGQCLERSAELHPDKVALICGDSRPTFLQIENSANSFAGALIEEGFQRQDRAVVYLDNSVESVVSLFGILKAGGIFVMVNPQVKARKLQYMLADCRARVLITDAGHLPQAAGVMPDLPGLQRIIITNYESGNTPGEQAGGAGLLSYSEMLERRPSSRPVRGCIDIDLAALVYTSGSSGDPKGVMLTHHNMLSAADSVIDYLGNNRDDILFNTLPLSFSYGLYQVLTAFMFGGTVVLEKSLIYLEQAINTVVREKVTGWPMVPTMVALLLRLKSLDRHDFSSLRYITSAGQMLPPKHIAQLIQVFPGVKIYSMYGLTECKRVSYLAPAELHQRPASVGKAMPNTEAYIVDEEDKEITGAGIPGELVVRGSNVMRGYWNLPAETDRSLRPGRYPGEKVLYTDDLFKMDAEGYLYFLSRKGDIIKTAGYRVSPREIEDVLCEREDVIEAAVIGVADDILGQAIKAFVHLADSSKATEKDIIKYCRTHLEGFAVPKYVTLCGELPRTESGKVRKLDLQ